MPPGSRVPRRVVLPSASAVFSCLIFYALLCVPKLYRMCYWHPGYTYIGLQELGCNVGVGILHTHIRYLE